MRWPALTRSTTARFVVLAFLFQMLVTGGVLLFVQQASQRALAGEQRELVGELREELLIAYRAGGLDALAGLIRVRLESVRGDTAVVLLAAGDGTPIAGNLGAWPTVVADGTDWRTIDLYRMGRDRAETMGVATIRLPDGNRLLTGHVIDASLKLARVNAEAMAVALLVGTALTLLSALILGRILGRQIERVVATADAVGAGALARRVPIDGSGDAFDALGQSINAMLERIEALVSQLRMMTDGLAHDLKSPVTRLKSVLERAIVDARDPDALAVLEKVSLEAETLLAMLSTALLISRTEAGIGRDQLVETDVAALLTDLSEIYGPLAEDHGFAIETHAADDLRAALHRELISQAIGNLIENALKYAAGGSRIAITAAREAGGLTIAVADDGPGIAEAQREAALRRFGRLDPARQAPGSGLGLSLVEAVARLHRGRVALQDNRPGLRVVLTLAL